LLPFVFLSDTSDDTLQNEDVMETPDQLRDALLKDVEAANSTEALEELRISALGKKVGSPS